MLSRLPTFFFGGVAAAIGLIVLLSGCGSTHDVNTIRVEGSDTMLNVAQAWSQKYREKRPDISVVVLGGGSGVGIASLIDGNCDMADTSRKMKDKEIQRAKARRGVEPIEHVVGYDSLAIYAHKNNPLDSISIEELAEIYGDGGKITKWSQLGVQMPAGVSDEITRVSRQNSSGTYAYFREAVLGEGRDYKLGSIDQSGSKDVVALVSNTPSAIGYSGMGYQTDEIKVLKLSRRKGEPGVAPTVENTKNGTYVLTRPLQIYTVGQPTGPLKDYLDWIYSPEGQQVVLELGYVPVFKKE